MPVPLLALAAVSAAGGIAKSLSPSAGPSEAGVDVFAPTNFSFNSPGASFSASAPQSSAAAALDNSHWIWWGLGAAALIGVIFLWSKK